jgi:hypothetical protein
LAVALEVADRAGVFCAVDVAAVCADTITGAEVIIKTTAATDTAIFVKQGCFAIKRLRRIVTGVSPISNRV